MVKIILTRHGDVEGIHPKRFRGLANIPLTEKGHKQAHLMADKIAELWQPAAIFSSPLQRCIDTSRPISERTGVPYTVINTLHDIDYGEWQYKTYKEVHEHEPALFDLWFNQPHLVRFPKGDSLQDIVSRTGNAIRMAMNDYKDKIVVFVAHDSINRALLLQMLDQPLSAYWRLEQSPCAINEIEIDEKGRTTVTRLNDTNHLNSID